MFQFLHAADVHLDSPLVGLSRYESAPVEAIRGATRLALERLVDLALEREVAFVLLAGDLFDGDWKDYNTGLFFAKQMGRLGKARIPVFLVAGNHDAVSRITHALTPPSNVTTLATATPQTVLLDDLGVAIHGQGFATQAVQDNLAAGFPAAVGGRFNIGLLHTSLDGREGHATYAPCSVDDLRARGYDYWALGHVHAREEVCADPWVVFPGCLQGRHARELGPKGCSLVTVEEGAVTDVEPVVLDVLRWGHVTVDLEGAMTEDEALQRIRDGVQAQVDDSDERPLALRMTLEGACAAHGAMAADPDRWVQQVRALGAQHWGDELWIEKVQQRTTGLVDVAAVMAGDTPLGELLRALDEAAGAGELAELAADITTLKAKLPPEVFEGEHGLDPEDGSTLADLVDGARDLLIARLLAGEETL